MKKSTLILIVVLTISLISVMISVQEKTQDNNRKYKIKKIPQFSDWARQFNKNYNSQSQKIFRMALFRVRIRQIQTHNKLFIQGKTTYAQQANYYADLTQQQIITHITWDQLPKITNLCNGSIQITPNPPQTIDWKNKSGQIGLQGRCQKDWAMIAVSAVEGIYAKNNTYTQLSVQQVMDCSGDYGSEGCYGGFMDQAFYYIVDNGLATVKSYPSVGQLKQDCKYSPNMKYVSVKGCARVPVNSYSRFISAVVQQSVSVAINFSIQMSKYSIGVWDGSCTKQMNKGMLVVGYGYDSDLDAMYWQLKNTLGVSWGENGYIRIKRQQGKEGKCGMMLLASIPQNVS